MLTMCIAKAFCGNDEIHESAGQMCDNPKDKVKGFACESITEIALGILLAVVSDGDGTTFSFGMLFILSGIISSLIAYTMFQKLNTQPLANQ